MPDRWYYTLGGQTFGPVTGEGLMQLAAVGRLAPTDLIWPEGRERAQAVEAKVALDLAAPPTPAKAAPDWLEGLRAEEEAPSPPPAPAVPDWIEDLRKSEGGEPERVPAPLVAGATPALPALPARPAADEVGKAAPPAPPVAAPPRPPAAAPLHLVIGSNSTRGLVRDTNEDSLLLRRGTWSSAGESQEVALVVVADGMGGHRGGGKASRIVTGAMAGVLPALLSAAAPGPATLAQALDEGLCESNRLIREAAQEDAACRDMGSTAVALLVWGRHAAISLVGDCRVYHWRAGRLSQVTRDQTLVARMVELGQLTPAEAATHPRRHEVAQALGKSDLLGPARYELTLEAGDWLIACSDGLTAHVEDQVICQAINEGRQSPFALASRLITLADQRGGSDNCTVVAVSCS
jgi:protein phosphatase